MKEIPEATKAYNRRHSVEVKVALDVLRHVRSYETTYDEDKQEVENETR